MWILLLCVVVIILMSSAFLVIARKGRQLRKNQPLPPKASQAYLEWDKDGRNTKLEIESPFYFGRNEDCDIVLADAKQNFEACVFSHQNRFAFQCLEGAESILVNGEETLAGYLWDGDVLTIAKNRFIFHCF